MRIFSISFVEYSYAYHVDQVWKLVEDFELMARRHSRSSIQYRLHAAHVVVGQSWELAKLGYFEGSNAYVARLQLQ